jgi:hypothetical protein
VYSSSALATCGSWFGREERVSRVHDGDTIPSPWNDRRLVVKVTAHRL